MSDSRPVALVTGATKRIGAAIARTLHQRGYDIAIHFGTSAAEAEALAAEFSGARPASAATFQADLCSIDAVQALAQAVVNHWRRVDALVNNASTFYPTPLGAATGTAWDDLVGSNLKGPFFLAQALAEELKKSRGAVVNIADINARYPLADYPIYSIAKGGLVMLTKVLARELAPWVHVNGVAPGSILWPEGKAEMSEEAKAKTLAKIPLQRVGTPEDIAALTAFLVATPGYITGQVIAVDGGINLGGDKT